MDILGTPGPARVSPRLEDALMGPKVFFREVREIVIMHENSEILSSADLRIRDVEECHQAFKKTFLGI